MKYRDNMSVNNCDLSSSSKALHGASVRDDLVNSSKEEERTVSQQPLTIGRNPVREGLSLLFGDVFPTLASHLDLDAIAWLGTSCRAARRAHCRLEGESYFKGIDSNACQNPIVPPHPQHLIPIRCQPRRLVGESTSSAAHGSILPESRFPPPDPRYIRCPILETRTRNDKDTNAVLARYMKGRLNFYADTNDGLYPLYSFYPFINGCREFCMVDSSPNRIKGWVFDARSRLNPQKFECVKDLTLDCAAADQVFRAAVDSFPKVERFTLCNAKNSTIGQWLRNLPSVHTVTLENWILREHPPILPPNLKKLKLTNCYFAFGPDNLSANFAHLTSIDIYNDQKKT